MSLSVKRILIDLIDLSDDPLPNAFIHFDETNIMDVYICLVGPADTPYEGTFFVFHVHFGTRYPAEPPRVWYLTPNEKIRFNPNLYENGKVCLSILGTWAGPQWTSVMNLRSLILSLQSILSEHPLRNEPGFESEPIESKKNLNYNMFIRYTTLRYALVDSVQKNTRFKHLMQEHIRDNASKYRALGEFVMKGASTPSVPIRTMYGMKILIDYISLAQLWKTEISPLLQDIDK